MTTADDAGPHTPDGGRAAGIVRAVGDYILGRRHNRKKKAVHDGGKGESRSGGQNEPHSKTADVLAAEYGVSPATNAEAAARATKEEAEDAMLADLEDQDDLGPLPIGGNGRRLTTQRTEHDGDRSRCRG